MNPGAPPNDALVALAAGKVIGVPTDTVYGLAALASNGQALQRIFEMKGRPRSFALPLLVADLDQAIEVVGRDDVGLRALAVKFWPGALTVVVRSERQPSSDLGGDAGTIGLRCPGDAVVRAMCQHLGPLAVTSANRHGEPPATTAARVHEAFGDAVEFVIDGGERDAPPSSVVSIVNGAPELLRSGAISLDEVEVALADVRQ